jgi:phytoene dehydrogenase-like protein
MSKSNLTAYYTLWDAVVVGAGHNGLTCAAYLAKEGHKFGIKRVLVVEKNSHIGGMFLSHHLLCNYQLKHKYKHS